MDKSVRSGRSLQDIGAFLYSVAVLALAAFGMAGLVYHCLSPHGMIAPWLGRVAGGYPIFTLLVAIGVTAITLRPAAEPRDYAALKGHTDLPAICFCRARYTLCSRSLMYGTL